MNRMSTRRIAAAVSGLLLVSTATLVTVGSASATIPAGSGGDVCVPADAWTEVIPAQGTPTIVVENEAYVPAEPAWVEYRTTEVTAYQKYVWQGEGKPIGGPGTGSHGWVAVGDPVTESPGSVDVIVKEGKSYVFWKTTTKVVTEKIHHEATPAKGEPTKEIPNPDYIPERVIEHPAVVCPEKPEKTGKTEVKVEAKATAVVTPEATAPAAPAASSTVVHVNG